MKLLCLIALLLISQNARVLVKSDASVDDVTDDYRHEITELKKQNQEMKVMLEELAKKVERQEETISQQQQTLLKTTEELVSVKSELTKKRDDVTSSSVISDTGKSTLCWTSCKQILVLISQKYSRPFIILLRIKGVGV